MFILLFIEGGSYVHVSNCMRARLTMQEDEDAWEFVTLFERRKRKSSDTFTYHFVGYVSVYPFWSYPDQIRLRLRWVMAVRLGSLAVNSSFYRHIRGKVTAVSCRIEAYVESSQPSYTQLCSSTS